MGDEGNNYGGGNTTNNNDANLENDHFPLWKYVTKLVRDGKAGGNASFLCNCYQRIII